MRTRHRRSASGDGPRNWLALRRLLAEGRQDAPRDGLQAEPALVAGGGSFRLKSQPELGRFRQARPQPPVATLADAQLTRHRAARKRRPVGPAQEPSARRLEKPRRGASRTSSVALSAPDPAHSPHNMRIIRSLASAGVSFSTTACILGVPFGLNGSEPTTSELCGCRALCYCGASAEAVDGPRGARSCSQRAQIRLLL
jgi:hypothetical protein